MLRPRATSPRLSTTRPCRRRWRSEPGVYLDRTGGDQGYFVAWVRQTLEEKLGRNTVRKGGLAIHTTLDPKLQDAAHTILTDTMSWTGAPAAALVSIDPRTGQVLAMDASVPFSKNAQFNIPAEAYRQVGSTFKMFTLTTAIGTATTRTRRPELSAHLSYLFPNTAVGPDNPWVVDTASDSEELNAPRTLTDADRRVGQHRVRAAGDRPGRPVDRQHGPQDGHPALDRAVALPLDHARRQPRLAAVDDCAPTRRWPPTAFATIPSS